MYVESGRKALEYMRNYIGIAKKVKDLVQTFWLEARVYVFGSVLTGKYTAASGINILVVLDEKPDPKEEGGVKASIYMELDAPMQLHVISGKELESWYKRFIGRMVEIT